MAAMESLAAVMEPLAAEDLNVARLRTAQRPTSSVFPTDRAEPLDPRPRPRQRRPSETGDLRVAIADGPGPAREQQHGKLSASGTAWASAAGRPPPSGGGGVGLQVEAPEGPHARAGSSREASNASLEAPLICCRAAWEARSGGPDFGGEEGSGAPPPEPCPCAACRGGGGVRGLGRRLREAELLAPLPPEAPEAPQPRGGGAGGQAGGSSGSGPAGAAPRQRPSGAPDGRRASTAQEQGEADWQSLGKVPSGRLSNASTSAGNLHHVSSSSLGLGLQDGSGRGGAACQSQGPGRGVPLPLDLSDCSLLSAISAGPETASSRSGGPSPQKEGAAEARRCTDADLAVLAQLQAALLQRFGSLAKAVVQARGLLPPGQVSRAEFESFLAEHLGRRSPRGDACAVFRLLGCGQEGAPASELLRLLGRAMDAEPRPQGLPRGRGQVPRPGGQELSEEGLEGMRAKVAELSGAPPPGALLEPEGAAPRPGQRGAAGPAAWAARPKAAAAAAWAQACAAGTAVTVSVSDGSQLEVDFEDMMLSCFKSQIAESTGIVVSDQAIFHDGQLLKEDGLLSSYGIRAGSYVYLVVCRSTASAMWPSIETRVREHSQSRRPGRPGGQPLSRPASAPRLSGRRPLSAGGAGRPLSAGGAGGRAPGAEGQAPAPTAAGSADEDAGSTKAQAATLAAVPDARGRNSPSRGPFAPKVLRRGGSQPSLRVVPPFEDRRRPLRAGLRVGPRAAQRGAREPSCTAKCGVAGFWTHSKHGALSPEGALLGRQVVL